MSDRSSGPTIDESTLAVVKAVAVRRSWHRGNASLAANAVAERVTGVTLPPRAGHDGWWLVGRVLDGLENVEFSVWYAPLTGRVGLSRRERQDESMNPANRQRRKPWQRERRPLLPDALPKNPRNA